MASYDPDKPDEAAPAPAGAAAPGVLHSWAPDQGEPRKASWRIGDIGLTLTDETYHPKEAVHPTDTIDRVVADLTAPGAPPLRLVLQSGIVTPQAKFGVGKMDPRSGQAQVLLASWTGGNDCCEQIYILTPGPTAWKVVDLGEWIWEVDRWPSDLNGDGYGDLVLYDNRFFDSFDCSACSAQIPVVLNLEDGAIADVTKNPAFRPLFERPAATYQAGCMKHEAGACAGYVAAASRLGRRAKAWPVMLANYPKERWQDQRTTDGWEIQACRSALPKDCTKPESQTFGDFPKMLDWFLRTTGYSG